MTSGIYMWFNAQNGKVYIGQAIDFRIRKNQYLSELRKGTHHGRSKSNPDYLQKAWDSYEGDDKHIILHDDGTIEELLGYDSEDRAVFETVLNLPARLKQILHWIENQEKD